MNKMPPIATLFLAFMVLSLVFSRPAFGEANPRPLSEVLDEKALAAFPEPPPAPSVDSVTGEERAAALRLIEGLRSASPEDAIFDAAAYTKNFTYHEVAVALTGALKTARTLPRRQGNTNEQIAAGALGEMGDPEAVDQLLEIVNTDPDKYNRISYIKALGRIGSYRALPLLDRTAEEKDIETAGEALLAMCRILEPAASDDYISQQTIDEYEKAVQTQGTPAAMVAYASVCCVKGVGMFAEPHCVREAVRWFSGALAAEPESPRAPIISRLLMHLKQRQGP